MIRLLMETGTLEWDLLSRVTHQAGSILPTTFRIANPTGLVRTYRIYLALFDASGAVIDGTTGALDINGEDTFEVAAESDLTLLAPLRPDYSNALLQAALYDVQSGEMAVGLQANLVQPPGFAEQIAPVVGFASSVMTLGMVAGMMSGMGKARR